MYKNRENQRECFQSEMKPPSLVAGVEACQRRRAAQGGVIGSATVKRSANFNLLDSSTSAFHNLEQVQE